MRILKTVLGLSMLLLLVNAGWGSPPEDDSGQVQIPLELYNQLVESAGDPTRHPRPAPATHALGRAEVAVDVATSEGRSSATVAVDLTVDVLENEWTLIPVLPSGTPVEDARVDDKPIQLIASPLGLAWTTRTAGSYRMKLVYKLDALRSPGGSSLAVPLPSAAAINLTATLPGTSLDATVIPSAGTRTSAVGETTRVVATIPTTQGVQISWRSADQVEHVISRASYGGQLSGDAVTWTAEIAVELLTDETITLPLLPRNVALRALEIDGEEGPILVGPKDDRLATRIRGRGMHRVTLEFEVQVDRSSGPPRVDLRIPAIPVSRFDLTLPGSKELTVVPASNVTRDEEDGTTTATVHVPMTDRVSFSWSEAVPEDLRTEIRANASTYHTVYAEEGVLYVRARLQYEVTRGNTSVIELELPGTVQINRIGDSAGAVTDWRLAKPAENGSRKVTVFLDRELEGTLMLDVLYDRSLGDDHAQGLEIPLVWVPDAQRQRGMVALLSSSDLALDPLEVQDLTSVGANQLPPFVRDSVSMTVAHTYKYAEIPPSLRVRPSVPEKVQGKFDAQVDTLISLGDVTLTGSATVAIHVKSGQLMELGLTLPDGVNLLNLTAPSLRTHRVVDADDGQRIEIEFTQEMEGQFRLELAYERITADLDADLEVPTLGVPEAEVEQGRIAIEALSAVEVQPVSVEQLTGLDIAELPRQLVLRTTNPILLAYKYVHANPRHRLALAVTRHPLLEVQEAAIDHAHYRTLFTRDGLLVTTAQFVVRNSRKQFLRVELPEQSEVWSAFVDGRPEQPAIADAEDGSRSVLIKILNSTEGFPVNLVYATHGPRIRGLGSAEAMLPRPDILVTRSRWEIYLPDGMRYGEPSTNLRLAEPGRTVSQREIGDEMKRAQQAAGASQAIRPLEIIVPTSGVHYAFEKLYANQTDGEARFSIPYASRAGAMSGQAASLAGVAIFWWGVGLYLRRRSRLAAVTVAFAGAAIVTVAVGVYHLGGTGPIVAALVIGVGTMLLHVRRHLGPPVTAQPAGSDI